MYMYMFKSLRLFKFVSVGSFSVLPSFMCDCACTRSYMCLYKGEGKEGGREGGRERGRGNNLVACVPDPE